jgi:flavodoxin
MRSLVVYHSKYEHTERVARAIVEGLAERGEAHTIAMDELTPEHLRSVELVVIGTPAQARDLTAKIRWFLHPNRGDLWLGMPVAAFDTRSHQEGTATRAAASVLAARLHEAGATLVAPPESFFVSGMKGPLEEGELARAVVWGRHLHLSERVAADGE